MEHLFAPVSRFLVAAFLLTCWADHGVSEPPQAAENFQPSQLVAWCIVPFDANKRGPAERAEMIRRLGMRRVAYDWRAEHVSEFEEEILQYQKHDIEYFAFWSWHDAMEPLIKKHGIKPQIWLMCKSPSGESHEAKVAEAAKSLLPMVEKTKALGLRLGIYNHGGWAGEPENMVDVCKYLRTHHDADHAGIIYNFHHGHEHIDRFAQALKKMQPFLWCLNLNGMMDAAAVRENAADKILPIGQGRNEKAMIEAVLESGYAGPIGILDHRSNVDSELALKANLDGLSDLLGDR